MRVRQEQQKNIKNIKKIKHKENIIYTAVKSQFVEYYTVCNIIVVTRYLPIFSNVKY